MKSLLLTMALVSEVVFTTAIQGEDCICAQWRCSQYGGLFEYYSQVCYLGSSSIETYWTADDHGEFPNFSCDETSCDPECDDYPVARVTSHSIVSGSLEPKPTENETSQEPAEDQIPTEPAIPIAPKRRPASVQVAAARRGLFQKLPREVGYPGLGELLNWQDVKVELQTENAIYVRVFIVRLVPPNGEPLVTTTALETTPEDFDMVVSWDDVTTVDSGRRKTRSIQFEFEDEELGEGSHTVTAMLRTQIPVKEKK